MVHGLYSILIFTISLFIGYLSYKLIIKNCGSFFKPTVSNVFMWHYIVFCFIGIVVLNVYPYFYWDERVWYRADFLMQSWCLVMFGTLLMPVGMILANKFWAISITKDLCCFKSFRNISQLYENNKMLKWIFLFFIIVITLVSVFYLTQLQHIPILGVFEGSSIADLAKLRSDATNNFPGKLYRYRFFSIYLLNAMVVLAFLLKDIKWYRYSFIYLFFFGGVMSVACVEKGILVNLILLILITYIISCECVIKKNVWSVIFVTGIFLILMYILFMGSNSILQAILSICSRTFMGFIVPMVFHYGYMEKYGLLYGLSLPNPSHIFPFDHCRLSVEVMNFAYPELVINGVVGSMPVVFFGEFLVNFGIYLALISMIMFGFFIRSLDILFWNNGLIINNPIVAALYISIMWSFKDYSHTSILGIMFDVNIIGVVVVLLIFMYFAKKGSNAVKE